MAKKQSNMIWLIVVAIVVIAIFAGNINKKEAWGSSDLAYLKSKCTSVNAGENIYSRGTGYTGSCYSFCLDESSGLCQTTYPTCKYNTVAYTCPGTPTASSCRYPTSTAGQYSCENGINYQCTTSGNWVSKGSCNYNGCNYGPKDTLGGVCYTQTYDPGTGTVTITQPGGSSSGTGTTTPVTDLTVTGVTAYGQTTTMMDGSIKKEITVTFTPSKSVSGAIVEGQIAQGGSASSYQKLIYVSGNACGSASDWNFRNAQTDLVAGKPISVTFVFYPKNNGWYNFYFDIASGCGGAVIYPKGQTGVLLGSFEIKMTTPIIPVTSGICTGTVTGTLNQYTCKNGIVQVCSVSDWTAAGAGGCQKTNCIIGPKYSASEVCFNDNSQGTTTGDGGGSSSGGGTTPTKDPDTVKTCTDDSACSLQKSGSSCKDTKTMLTCYDTDGDGCLEAQTKTCAESCVAACGSCATSTEGCVLVQHTDQYFGEINLGQSITIPTKVAAQNSDLTNVVLEGYVSSTLLPIKKSAIDISSDSCGSSWDFMNKKVTLKKGVTEDVTFSFTPKYAGWYDVLVAVSTGCGKGGDLMVGEPLGSFYVKGPTDTTPTGNQTADTCLAAPTCKSKGTCVVNEKAKCETACSFIESWKSTNFDGSDPSSGCQLNMWYIFLGIGALIAIKMFSRKQGGF